MSSILRFSKANPVRIVIAQFEGLNVKDPDNILFKNLGYPYFDAGEWFQPVENDDDLTIQFDSSFDQTNDVKLKDYTNDAVIISASAIEFIDETEYKVYQYSFDLTGVQKGFYYIEVSGDDADTKTYLAVSEPLYIKSEHKGSRLLSYYNNEPWAGVDYRTGVTFNFRVPGLFIRPSDKNQFEPFTDSGGTTYKITDQTTSARLLELYRVPSWIVQKVNLFLAHDNQQIDGVEVVGEEKLPSTDNFASLLSSPSTAVPLKQSDLANLHDSGSRILLPAAPANFSGVSFRSNQIYLSWNDISSNETGFEIQRSTTSGSDYVSIHTSAPDAESYSDDDGGAGLTPGTTYYYRMRALGSMNSPFTPEIAVKTHSIVEINTNADPSVDGDWATAITYVGSGTVKWVFESGDVLEGINISATNANSGLDGTLQVVKLEVVEPELIQEFLWDSSTGNDYKLTDTLILTLLTGITKLYLIDNSITQLTTPNNTSVCTDTRIDGESLTALDFSNFKFSGVFWVRDMTTLASITFGTVNNNLLSNIIICNLTNAGFTTIDISKLQNINGSLDFRDCDNVNSLVMPPSYILTFLSVSGLPITTLPLSNATFTAGLQIFAQHCDSINTFEWPVYNGDIHEISFAFSDIDIDFNNLTINNVGNRIVIGPNNQIQTINLSIFGTIPTLWLDAANLDTVQWPTSITERFECDGSDIVSLPMGTVIIGDTVSMRDTGATGLELDQVITTLKNNIYTGGVLDMGGSGNGTPSAASITDMTNMAASDNWTFVYWDGSIEQIIT